MAKLFRFITSVILLTFIFQSNISAQQLLQNDGFKYIPTYQGQAVLIKEIPLEDISIAAQNYTKLKSWIKKTYTTDLINSGIIYYENEQSVAVKSKVELLFPLLNAENMSEKATMKYNLDAFISSGKCVLIISDITYKIRNSIPKIKKKVKAENFVTNDALNKQDEFQKEKIEAQKGTLYFFNNLSNDLEAALNQPIKH